jgi:ubiquinone/menaquinone biosynthesis C-methylase UbiE
MVPMLDEINQELGRYIKSLEHSQIPYWPGYMSAQEYRFREILASMPSCPTGIKMLDIGTTPFTCFIKKIYPHYEVSTLDISDHTEDWFRDEDVQFRICNVATQPIPFEDDYFDVVIFTEVLEHLPTPPSAVLKEVRRVLRTGGGELILSIPNIAALHSRLGLLFGITPLADPDLQFGDVRGHLHEYTMKEISSKLVACGFAVSQRKYLQPSVKHALVTSGMKPFGLAKALYYATGFLPLVPSLRITIYIESYKPT